jgi:hypothetical protein
MGSQDGGVSIEASLWPGQSEVRTPVGAKDFLFSKLVQTSFRAHSAPLSMGTDARSQEIKWPPRNIKHSLPPNAEERIRRSYTSTRPKCVHRANTEDFNFYSNTCDVLIWTISPLLSLLFVLIFLYLKRVCQIARQYCLSKDDSSG